MQLCMMAAGFLPLALLTGACPPAAPKELWLELHHKTAHAAPPSRASTALNAVLNGHANLQLPCKQVHAPGRSHSQSCRLQSRWGTLTSFLPPGCTYDIKMSVEQQEEIAVQTLFAARASKHTSAFLPAGAQK